MLSHLLFNSQGTYNTDTEEKFNKVDEDLSAASLAEAAANPSDQEGLSEMDLSIVKHLAKNQLPNELIHQRPPTEQEPWNQAGRFFMLVGNGLSNINSHEIFPSLYKGTTLSTHVILGEHELDSNEDNLSVSGKTIIKNKQVFFKTSVSGELYAEESIFGDIDGEGRKQLINCIVKGNIAPSKRKNEINGGKIHRLCEIGSASLKNQSKKLEIDEIHITCLENDPESFVELSGKEITVGSITFEGGTGKVYLKDGAKLLNGVKNGTIEKAKL